MQVVGDDFRVDIENTLQMGNGELEKFVGRQVFKISDVLAYKSGFSYLALITSIFPAGGTSESVISCHWKGLSAFGKNILSSSISIFSPNTFFKTKR